ncbi:sodium:solute symporter family protein [Alphaproteobacteria bacterium]|jgi:Na+/proline symporter|nr:sodium:solute symporter family protein [Alphaproteobacteria bacterium]MDB2564662.1 sodium:solute symporter family protein [Alphaproteobacteria bacterium]MDB2636222.1 sodium:solute symporter family protein [Alphaproteobacteria bacterium]MDB3973781.1 sodium:solute symporter family protein [Alphaproteobacteria bacterium]MDC0968332.1 sodium:solute symporter family protein [Alphaproteobacteria bacterium]
MLANLYWFFFFLVVYWSFCLFWGARTLRTNSSPESYYLADRSISSWVFFFSATAATFAGITIITYPSLIYADGYSFLATAAIVITIPLGSILFFKRQWMLSRKYNLITPGEMYFKYYKSHTLRITILIIALFFAVPFLGIIIGATGSMVEFVSAGELGRDSAMWVLTAVVLFYVVSGGFKSMISIGVVQSWLFFVLFISIGFGAFYYLGGLSFFDDLATANSFISFGSWGSTQGYGGGDLSGFFNVPGVIQWVGGLGKNNPSGGPWTAVMILSFTLSYMGIVLSPTFSMWSYSVKSPKSFYYYQIWGSGAIVGIFLFIFAALLGVGANLLGANPSINLNGFALSQILPELDINNVSSLIFSFIGSLGSASPILVGLLSICLIAALQSTLAAFLMTSGSMVARDLYRPYIDKDPSWKRELLVARLAMLLICLAALYLATFFETSLILLGGLAIAFGFQLFPVLLGMIWFPWITKTGATLGLITGMFFVILAETFGHKLTGNALPWGRWPLTIYSGLWGLFFNVIVCFLSSAFSSNDADKEHRKSFHDFMNDHMGIHPSRKKIKSFAYVLFLIWAFFSIGPGLIFGNLIFGSADLSYSKWVMGIPSLWAYQIIWWAAGVLLIWFMANKMDLSTLPKKPILNGDEYSAPDDIEDKGNYIDKMGGGYGWPLILIGMAVATVILSVYAL